MDKSHYQQIQTLIEQNPSISGFDLYYLGFFSHFVPNFTLQDIFTHIANIISLHSDQLITNEEKIEFLIRMLSKKIDVDVLKTLLPQTNNAANGATKFLQEYFSQILKLLQKHANVSKFEEYYLGRFHALCPSYKIAELFHHINNINQLVTEDLIDEETQVDFLLKMLNKKILQRNVEDTALNIPQEGLSPYRPQDRSSLDNSLIKTENSPIRQEEPQMKPEKKAQKESMPVQRELVNMQEEVGSRKSVSMFEEHKQSRMEIEDNKAISAARRNDDLNASSESSEENSNSKQQNRSPKQNILKQFTFQNSATSGEDSNAPVRKEVSSNNESQQQGYQSPKHKVFKQFSFQNSITSGDDLNNSLRKENIANDLEDANQADDEVEKNDNKVNEGQDSISNDEDESQKGGQEDEAQEKGTEEDREEKNKDDADESGSVGYRTPMTVDFQTDNQVQILVGEGTNKDTDEDEDEDEREQPSEEGIPNQDSFEEEPQNNNNEISQENGDADEQADKMIVENQANDHAEKNKNLDNLISQEPQSLDQVSNKYGASMEEENVPKVPNPTEIGVSESKQLRSQNSSSLNTSNQEDNQPEIKKIMDQLYPEIRQGKLKGTLEDILNSLLESDEGKSEVGLKLSQMDRNSLMASLASQLEDHNRPSNPKINLEKSKEPIFPVPKSYKKDQKQYDASLEVIDEARSANKSSGAHSPISNQDGKEVENISESQVRESVTQEDLTSIGQSQQDFSMPDYLHGLQKLGITESQTSRPDHSLILKYMISNKANLEPSQKSDSTSNHPHRDHLLQQAVSYIQPSLLEDQLQPKQEESESRALRDANTHTDPTLEDGQDFSSDRMASLITRTPNDKEDELFPSIRACTTVKQTLSQLKGSQDVPNGGHENDVSIVQSEQDGYQPGTQSQKRNFNELYPTQNSKVSSFPGKTLNTLEEERSALELLEDLQREKRGSGNQSKTAMLLEEKSQSQGLNKSHETRMEVEVEKSRGTNEEAKSRSLSQENIRRKRRNHLEDEEQNSKQQQLSQDKPKPQQSITLDPEVPVETMNVEVINQSKKPAIVVELSKCSLCMDNLTGKPISTLEACTHKFHEKCLQEYLARKIDERALPITCPRQECQHTLLLVDLMDLVEPSKQEKYIATSLKTHIELNTDVCCCPTPGCAFAFLKVYRKNRFRCSLCKKTYCMSCQAEWHQGMSCEDYQASHKKEAGEADKLIGKKIKQCPSCKVWVGKKLYSNKMECSCGVTFCYCCGKVKIKECDHQDSEQVPIVQPDLFHRAMQSPQEYRLPLNNKGENIKTVTSGIFTAGAATEAQKLKPIIDGKRASIDSDREKANTARCRRDSRSRSKEKL